MSLHASARSAAKILGAAALGLALSVGAANAAHAATNQTITVTCSGGAPVFSSQITVGVNDTVTLLNSAGGDLNLNSGTSGTGLTWSGGPTWTNTTSKVLTVTDRAGAGVPIIGPAGCTGSTTLSFGSGSGGSSSASAPAPIFQQFGKPAAGSCDAAAPATLNWSGVASGGWGNSWSQWMNGGTGGFVCTRTLVYSTNLATWVLG